MKLIPSAMFAISALFVTGVSVIPIEPAIAQADHIETYPVSGEYDHRQYNSVTVNFTRQLVCFNFADGGGYTMHVDDYRLFTTIIGTFWQQMNNMSGD